MTGEQKPSYEELLDFCEELFDFCRNVAGLDDRLINDPGILKQWRDDARALLDKGSK